MSSDSSKNVNNAIYQIAARYQPIKCTKQIVV